MENQLKRFIDNKKARLDVNRTAKPLTQIIAHYIDNGYSRPLPEGQGADSYEYKNYTVDGYESSDHHSHNESDYTEEGIYKDWGGYDDNHSSHILDDKSKTQSSTKEKMNFLTRIKNQLKLAIDDIHENYENELKEIEKSNPVSFEEDIDYEEDIAAYEKEKLNEAIKILDSQNWHCIRCGYLLKFTNYKEAFCTNKECCHGKYCPLTVRTGESYSVAWER